MLAPDFKITFCTFFSDKKEFVYENESYDEYVMFALSSGSFSYSFDNSREYTAKCGDAVVCAPHRVFHRKIIKSMNFCMLKFTLPCSVFEFDEAPISFQDEARFFYNLDMLNKSIFVTNMLDEHITNHFCRDLLYLLFNTEATKSNAVTSAVTYINSHYTESISNSYLASLCGYSAVHFINLFKKYYSCTPQAYIARLRINKSQLLLKTTNLSIEQIAQQCGFSDAMYFSRFFKKHCFVSPCKFKAQMQRYMRI